MKDNDFSRYIERVEQLKSEKKEGLADADLLEIAKEVGLSEEDLAEANAQSAKSLNRAKEFFERGMLKDALSEATDSLSLAPWDKETMLTKAQILEALWNKGDTAAGEQAKEICHRIIKIDSLFEPAFDILARIENPPILRVIGKYIVATGLVGFLGLAFYSGIGTSGSKPVPASLQPTPTVAAQPIEPADPKPADLVIQTEKPVTPSPLPPSLEEPFDGKTNNDSLPTVSNRSVEVPLYLSQTPQTRGILLTSYTSVVRFGYYTVSCNFLNSSDRELTVFKTKLEFFNSKGMIMDSSHDIAFLDTYQGAIRPSDNFGRGGTYSVKHFPHCPSAVRLSVTDQKSTKAPATYGKGSKINVVWETQKPDHLNLTASLRSSSFKEAVIFKDKGKYQAVSEVAFHNPGPGTYKLLVCKTRYYYPGSDPVDSGKKYISMSSWEPFGPKETRVETSYDQLNAKPDHQEIIVIEIK